MKILYLSSHSVLEYDEVKLFTELGHSVFSMGAYQTGNQGSNLRGPIPNLYHNPDLIEIAHKCSKENIDPQLLEWCDVVVSMHNSPWPGIAHPQPWISENWSKFKKSKKPIVWRSIGQSSATIEKSLEKYRAEGLKIVRYSPKEDTIPYYVGSDAMIRFYADPSELSGYTGENPRIVNISQAMFGSDKVKSRGDHMNINEFKQMVEGFDWRIFGPDNENAGEHNGGLLNYDDLKSMLRFNRVYDYTGTRPASYTLAVVDAMMTGMPIVSIGPKWGNSIYRDQQTFELHEIIGKSGEAGFWSDDLMELRSINGKLLADIDLARIIGSKGRERAIELFGKEKIKKEWEAFLNDN